MIIVKAPQGTPEWHQARAGVITASMFSTAREWVDGLTDQQRIYVDGKEIPRDDLGAALGEVLATSESKRVVLQGDRDVILGDVVRILEQARNAGADEVAIAATRGSGAH